MPSDISAKNLQAFMASERIHRRYNLRREEGIGNKPIDVFELISRENVFLAFRPLDKLHGAYIPTTNGSHGILINSRHPMQLQRFTAAHELGHFTFKHKPSLDTEFLGRAPTASDRYEGNGSDPEQEKEADCFASAFLMPDWLIKKHLKQINKSKSYLTDPSNIYQMSLRLSVSFTSLCWGLSLLGYINLSQARQFTSINLKEIKKKIVLEELLKETNSWANVWQLDQNSNGLNINGGINDIFSFELEEIPSSGYKWDYKNLKDKGFRIISEEILDIDRTKLGSGVKRKMVFTNDLPFSGSVSISKKRVWNNDVKQEIVLNFNLSAKIIGFYSRTHKKNA